MQTGPEQARRTREQKKADKPAAAPEKPKELERTGLPRPDGSEWDLVDEQSWESFPASDPPGRSASTASRKQVADDSKADDEPAP